MRTVKVLSGLLLFPILTGLLERASAAPFVPLQWQQRIKAGALLDQRKHTGWIRDQNGDFLDDAFDSMRPGEKTKVIIQLSECLGPEELAARFAPFGNVRRIGTLVAYVVLDDVRMEDLPILAKDSIVAAIERPRVFTPHLDTSTRAIRARASTTFTPETFAESFPGFNGAGINIAVVDSGVDDAVHAAFAGKFVSGYDACADMVLNPDDDIPDPVITTGADGICNTVAAGDDVQQVAFGGTPPNMACVGLGPNGILNTAPVGDDFIGAIPWNMFCSSANLIASGANGICNTAAVGDDDQIVPVGQRPRDITCITPGPNGVIDTVPAGDDQPGVVHHGTHVAGTALGLGIGAGCRNADDGSVPNNCGGVATGAGLVDVKVFANGCVSDDELIIRGLEWIWTDGNAHVVNMSLGTDEQADGTDTIANIINALVANDIAVVVSAGNSGGNCLGRIAAAELAITVANADDRGTVDRADDHLSWTSTFGPRGDFNALNPTVGMLKPDLAAPGSDIIAPQGNTANTYHALSGTSMASPHVAGAAALLLDLKPDLPPGSLKELLKRTAFQTPEHVAAGASFPAIDGVFHVNWGFGMLDLFEAADQLAAGITDISFTACVAAHPDYPDVRRCEISGGRPSYANDTDIVLATDPPIQEEPNTITLLVENNGMAAAQNVTVCVGVKELGAGLNEFYDVGCRTIANIGPGAVVMVAFPWTPTANSHQCIQATIDYGFDTDFSNNLTQRNTSPVPSSSPAVATFRVENPLPEPATIVLTPIVDDRTKTNFNFDIGQRTFQLRPQDCPRLQTVQFNPNGNLPIGTTGTVIIAATAFSRTYPEGLELSGVVFHLRIVASGLRRAYSCADHQAAGEVNIPLALAGRASTDPRLCVRKIKAIFTVPLRPGQGFSLSNAVQITALGGSRVPAFHLSFPNSANSGTDLTIEFTQPLRNGETYRFDFSDRMVDLDGDKLTGDPDFDLQVVQGDANNSGLVTGTDVTFVRSLVGQPVLFRNPARADGNQDGQIDQADVTYVAKRVGTTQPILDIRRNGKLVEISWYQLGYALQSAPNLTGPWGPANLNARVDCTTHTVILQPSDPRRFFRLIRTDQ